MAASLRLTLMFHVEDDKLWRWRDPPINHDEDALAIGAMATAVGQHGAKVSVQYGRWFVDQCGSFFGAPGVGTHYSPPTSLKLVLDYGGNFWCHAHSTDADFLQSLHVCVGSAVAGEIGESMEYGTCHAAGQSGGGEVDDPDLNWVSISVFRNILRKNSSSVGMCAQTPESLRPYGISATDMRYGAYFHDMAPGPLADDFPATMRQRPFWINQASGIDSHDSLRTTYPHTDLVGSVMVIPQPCRYQLTGFSEGRSATSISDRLTMSDFDAALTHLWTCSEIMANYLDNITNV